MSMKTIYIMILVLSLFPNCESKKDKNLDYLKYLIQSQTLSPPVQTSGTTYTTGTVNTTASNANPLVLNQWGENYIALLSRNDCKAMISGRGHDCDTADCKGFVLKNAIYCKTDDCKGYARSNFTTCDSSLCKALVSKNRNYCKSSELGYRDCRALISGVYTDCKSTNCRALVRKDKNLCSW
jgi:hypothetical protein